MVESHVVMLDMLFTTVRQNLSLNSNKLKTMTILPELIITNTGKMLNHVVILISLMLSGGPPRIGDVFEFIQDWFVESDQLKTGIPLNVVLISDGQTQGDDKENMEKWTSVLKKVIIQY